MRLIILPLLLSTALLSAATAATTAPAAVAVNASVEDACEITGTNTITFDYQAAATSAAVGTGQVLVRCNLNSSPFLGYWDDTQWNSNGSVDLMNGSNKLNVVLSADVDPTLVGSDSTNGSRYVYNVTATAAAGQWTAPTGAYTKVVDFYVGW